MDVFKEGKYFRYVEKAPIWITISLVVIIAGIAFMLVNRATMGSPFNLSIHYTMGVKLLLEFDEELPLDGQAIKQLVEKYSDGEPIVQVYADNPRIVSIRMRVAGVGEGEGELSAETAGQ